MKRGIAWLLFMCVLALAVPAIAEESFTMAGYDDSGTGHVWETNLFFQRMEEKTGVHFTFQQFTDSETWQQKKAELLSGDEMPDVLFKADLSVEETERYYASGALIDLKPYIASCMPNLAALLEAHPDWEAAITLPNGAIAALPTINTLQNNNAIWINKTWLDNLGLDMPTTADELLEVLRAFKTRDPNQNSKQDEIPVSFMGMWDLKFLGHAFGLVSNDYGVYLDTDGQVKTTLNVEENRAFLTWLNTLWEENLLDHNGFSTIDSLRQITDSNATMTYGMFFAPTPLNLVPAASMNQYEVLLPLTYEGKQVYRDLLGDVVRGSFAVTSACKDPETILRWVDYLYSEEGSMLAQAGQEGVEYERNADGTWVWMDSLETVANSVLSEATIADGGNAPGYYPAELQLTFDNSDTHRIVSNMQTLKEYAVYPYPLVYLGSAARERVNAIQLELGAYAENAMVRFVTGDIPLTDESWNDYTAQLDNLGLQEMLEIWQNALK